MESTQLIGAFKARGAFSALTHLSNSPSDPSLPGLGLDTLRHRGVTTHSSGNHAQALALAASSLAVPATIVMPSISTASKISGTRNTPGVSVVFSGSTSVEREEMVEKVISEGRERNGGDEDSGPILVPPYDHPDIILGQGTAGLEMERQFADMKRGGVGRACSFASGGGDRGESVNGNGTQPHPRFDAVITPLGGGGLLSGTATYFSHTHDSTGGSKKTLVFGAEPRYQGANDGERGLASNPPQRIPHVKSLTIADGLRTPLGTYPWSIISNPEMVQGVYSVSEVEIKMAAKLLMERMKVFVEPSGVVGLAVLLFNQRFREWVGRRQEEERRRGGEGVWDVGVLVSGGNTTVEALSKIFGEGWMDEIEEGDGDGDGEVERERAVGEVGVDGKKVAEDVAG